MHSVLFTSLTQYNFYFRLKKIPNILTSDQVYVSFFAQLQSLNLNKKRSSERIFHPDKIRVTNSLCQRQLKMRSKYIGLVIRVIDLPAQAHFLVFLPAKLKLRSDTITLLQHRQESGASFQSFITTAKMQGRDQSICRTLCLGVVIFAFFCVKVSFWGFSTMWLCAGWLIGEKLSVSCTFTTILHWSLQIPYQWTDG